MHSTKMTNNTKSEQITEAKHTEESDKVKGHGTLTILNSQLLWKNF